MKKRCFYCLMVTLLLFGMTACGKESSTEEASTQEVTTQEQTETTTEEVTTEEVTTEATTEEVTTEEITEATTTEEATTEAATEEVTTEAPAEATKLTPDQAMDLLAKTLGEKDDQTGNEYAFNYVSTMTVDGSEYHVFMWGWYVDGHMSKLTDMFVKVDGTAIYEGLYSEANTMIYNEKNYLE